MIRRASVRTNGSNTGTAGGAEPDSATARESRGVHFYEGTPRTELSPARPPALHTLATRTSSTMSGSAGGRAGFDVGCGWFLPTRFVEKCERVE
jgi:hypothetical protein